MKKLFLILSIFIFVMFTSCGTNYEYDVKSIAKINAELIVGKTFHLASWNKFSNSVSNQLSIKLKYTNNEITTYYLFYRGWSKVSDEYYVTVSNTDNKILSAWIDS